MPARAALGSRITAGLVLAATALAACTSSGSPTVRPSTATSGSNLGRASSSAGSTSTAPVDPSPGPAPTALQASSLLMAAGLPTVLGTKGLQDDGGSASTYPSPNFVSVAETANRVAKFRVGLQTYQNPADAMTAYEQAIPSGGAPLAGLGDKAMIQAAQQVVVLKGSQVLVVGIVPTPATEEYIKEHYSATVMVKTLDRPVRAAATAIARHLTGAALSGTFLQLPAGAINPCALATKAISAGTKQAVTAINGPSEQYPAQQCDVSIGGSPYIVQTYTSTQAAAALPATTLAAVYAQDAKRTTPGQRLHTESAHLQAFVDIDLDFTLEVLVTTTPGANWRTTPGERAHQALVRIMNSHTGPVTKEQCYALGKGVGMIPGITDAETETFFGELIDWCSKFPSGAK